MVVNDRKAPSYRTEWNGPVSTILSDQTGTPLVTQPVAANDLPAFEDNEQELDDDEAFLPFVQELNLSLGTSVLDLAVPAPPTVQKSGSPSFDPNVPLLMQTNIVVVAVCADSSVRLITLPLTPPSAAAKRAHTLAAQICTLAPSAPTQAKPRHVALSWTSRALFSGFGANNDEEQAAASLDPMNQKLDLLVAVSGYRTGATLDLFRVSTHFDPDLGGKIPTHVDAYQTLQLAAPAARLAFNPSTYPSPKHSQIMFADTKGSLKVYDPLAPESSRSRPSSRDSMQDSVMQYGAWIISFSSPYHVAKDASSAYPALSQRKKIIDASWLSAGRSILVLLSDGEWGIWIVDGTGSSLPTAAHSASLTQFAIKGFIGEGSSSEPAAQEHRSRSNQRLAPMTPNTRRVRQESLFSGPTNTTSANALKGGISVSPATSGHGTADDSIVMWYAGEAYHIASLASYWQRSANSSGRDVGSLYGPGLARIEGLDLCGEILNDVEQTPPCSYVGNITQGDILITAEYRFIFISSPRAQAVTSSLFTRDTGSPSATFDLQLLEKGELDLGGVDRFLDGMGGAQNNGFGRAKRVGFAR